MNTPFFSDAPKPGWLRRADLAVLFVAGMLLCGCTPTATQTAPPSPVTAQPTQAPSPDEVKLGEPPKMPAENK